MNKRTRSESLPDKHEELESLSDELDMLEQADITCGVWLTRYHRLTWISIHNVLTRAYCKTKAFLFFITGIHHARARV